MGRGGPSATMPGTIQMPELRAGLLSAVLISANGDAEWRL